MGMFKGTVRKQGTSTFGSNNGGNFQGKKPLHPPTLLLPKFLTITCPGEASVPGLGLLQ